MIRELRETRYSPEDDVKSFVDQIPTLAKTSLHIKVYGFTDLALTANIIDAAKRGVQCFLIIDHTQATGKYAKVAIQKLVDAGAQFGNIFVKIVESPAHQIMHLKAIGIDLVNGPTHNDSMIGSGSYNFSDSAQKQVNSFVWTNSAAECLDFIATFERHWETLPQNEEWQFKPTIGEAIPVPPTSFNVAVLHDEP